MIFYIQKCPSSIVISTEAVRQSGEISIPIKH